VATHGGKDKRLGAEILQVVHYRADDDGDIRDASATRPHGDGVTRLTGKLALDIAARTPAGMSARRLRWKDCLTLYIGAAAWRDDTGARSL